MTIPTIAPIRTIGAIRTNPHSKQWKAVPRTAVSGSLKFQPKYGLFRKNNTAVMSTITIANEIKSQCATFLRDCCLRESWRLITSSFWDIAFRSSVSGSLISSPSKALTGVSSASDNAISNSESGTDRPCSHFEIVCRTTFSLTASSCCVRPFAFLIVLMFSLNMAKASFRSHDTINRCIAASNAN